MSSIYYDGSKYHSVAKHRDGSYVKWEVDKLGRYQKGGSIHRYNTKTDMTMDLHNMYQIGGYARDTSIYGNAQTITPGNHSSQLYPDDGEFNYGFPNDNKTMNYGLRNHPSNPLNTITPKIANKPLTSNYTPSTFTPIPLSPEDFPQPKKRFKFKARTPREPKEPKKPVGETPYKYNPRKLNAYGNKISENALDRTTAFNLASAVAEGAYRNPLIIPEFKHKQQYAQANYNPIYESERDARQDIAQNVRSSSGLIGNLLQLNANSVKAKMKTSKEAQALQKGYDADFTQKQADHEVLVTNARQNVENLNKADQGEKRQYLSDTMTNWEKADQEKAKLYNAELSSENDINTYVNQLSPEYKVVTDRDGVKRVEFWHNGKKITEEEAAALKAKIEEIKAKNKQAADKQAADNVAKGLNADGSPKKRDGGNVEVKMDYTRPVRKIRNRLY